MQNYIRQITITACLALTLILMQPSAILAGPIQARSAILLNLDTIKIIYEQNADAKVAPASLTKVLAMYVAFDAIKAGRATLNDKVTISAAAASQGGSRMGLKQGEAVTLERLLLGMAVSSGNDASVAVAEHIAGSHAAFVRAMNAKAQNLRMRNSIFENAHGLPAQKQITTARDLLHLSRNYIMVHPQALRYHATRSLTHRGYTSTNKNPLLNTYQGADGLKTGWITASGYNIIATARRGGTRLVAIILGANSAQIREKEIKRLMDAGFAFCAGQSKSVAAHLGI